MKRERMKHNEMSEMSQKSRFLGYDCNNNSWRKKNLLSFLSQWKAVMNLVQIPLC